MAEPYSTNADAERIMGRRPEGFPVDMPVELGYWCPVCRVSPEPDFNGNYDERLCWSEYNGFLWCAICNRDYPSALCVPLDAEPDPSRPYVKAGVDAAIAVYLATVEEAKARG